jgi:adenylate kinase family enzyme
MEFYILCSMFCVSCRMNLIILGPQGSGKGTQAKLLADHFDLIHIDVGLVLRQAAEEDTPLGKELHHIMYEEKGLVSDEEITKVLKEKLKDIPQEIGRASCRERVFVHV